MKDLLKYLEHFNRKERFFLLSQALGQRAVDNTPRFQVDGDFLRSLCKVVGIKVPLSEQVFMAMDYHLNWIHASLVLAYNSDRDKRIQSFNAQNEIRSSQEDVDLLVAFPQGDRHHLIFVEAKGYDANGLANFDRGRLKEKTDRLCSMVKPYEDVESYYCLMSGYEPQNLSAEDWPKWKGQPLKWLELSLPPKRLVVYYGQQASTSSISKVKGVGKKRFTNEQIVPPKT